MATALTDLPLPEALTRLARLLEYPAADLAAVADGCPEAAALLALAPDAREECYTSTFDLAPACTPYVSVHLFGEESFKRAALMAALNERHAAVGLAGAAELPDHVARLLALAARVDRAECRELAAYCLLGPLAGMRDATAAVNPYRAVIAAAEAVLRGAFPDVEAAPVARLRGTAPAAQGPESGCAGCATVGACAEGEA